MSASSASRTRGPAPHGAVGRRHATALETRGWTVVRGLIPPDAVERARADILRTLDEHGPDAVCHGVFEGHDRCPPLRHSPEIMQLLHDTPLLRAAALFVGTAPFEHERCSQTTMRLPSPGPRPEIDAPPNRVHVDGALWGSTDEPATMTLQVGVLLSDHDRPECGALHVWDGSHRRLAERLRGIGRPVVGNDIAQATWDLWGELRAERAAPSAVLGSPGDVYFGTNGLVHCATTVHTPHPRIAVYFRLRAAGHRPQVTALDPVAELAGLASLRRRLRPVAVR